MTELDQKIIEVVTSELKNGKFEEMLRESFAIHIKKYIDESFGNWGKVKNSIKDKIEETMVPYIKSMDLSVYLPKLDMLLVEIINNTSVAEDATMLSNFKELMLEDKKEKSIEISKVFSAWMDIVAEDVDTDGLEVCYDDEPYYESVDVSYEIEEEEGREWSNFDYAVLNFMCEHDKSVNVQVRLSRWKSDRELGWKVNYDNLRDFSSLRHLNKFEVLLMKMQRSGIRLITDKDFDEDGVCPEKEPEATFA